MFTPTEGAHSRTAREFIGSDNGSMTSRLVPAPLPSLSDPSPIGNIRSIVHTEVRSTDGAALWVVKGFSKLDDKPGFCVFSPEFLMAGAWWKMQLFPSGGGRNDSASSEGHASLYLFATRAPVKAKYSLALLKAPPLVAPPQPDTNNSVVPGSTSPTSSTSSTPSTSSTSGTASSTTPATTHDGDRLADEAGVLYVCHGSTKSFGSPSEGWGFLKFYSRRQLMIGQWAARDEIRLEANVSVITGIHHTADSRQPGNTHMSSVTRFQHQMSRLLETPDDADVTFAVTAGPRGSSEPTIMKAHKLLLTTRSPYFRAMLRGSSSSTEEAKCGSSSSMQEARSGYVVIDHCRPSVFKQLLRFIYTGACDLSGVGNERPTAGETSSVICALDDDSYDPLQEDRGRGKKAAPSSSSGGGVPAEGKGEKVVHIEPESSSDDDDEDLNEDTYSDDKEAVDKVDTSVDEQERNREQAATKEKWGRKRQQLQRAVSGQVGNAISDAALELLCAADRYDAADLRGLCEHYLMDTLSSLNCVHRTRMADLIGRLPLLRAMGIKFITELSPTVRTDKAFTAQLHALPKPLLIELLSAQQAVQAHHPAPPPTSTSSIATGQQQSASSMSRPDAPPVNLSSNSNAPMGSPTGGSVADSGSRGQKRGAEEMLLPSPNATLPGRTVSPPSGSGTISPPSSSSSSSSSSSVQQPDARSNTSDSNAPPKRLRMSDINQMRISELKDELGKRGISILGKKAELVARLLPFTGSSPVPVLATTSGSSLTSSLSSLSSSSLSTLLSSSSPSHSLTHLPSPPPPLPPLSTTSGSSSASSSLSVGTHRNTLFGTTSTLPPAPPSRPADQGVPPPPPTSRSGK